MAFQRVAWQAQNQIGNGSQPAPPHMDFERLVGFQLDGLPLYLAQYLLVERLHRLIENQGAADLLDRFDDPVRPVLSSGCVDEHWPAVIALHFADMAGDFDIALKHSIV